MTKKGVSQTKKSVGTLKIVSLDSVQKKMTYKIRLKRQPSFLEVLQNPRIPPYLKSRISQQII